MAAFGIVWFHLLMPDAALAYAGLAAFLSLSTLLARPAPATAARLGQRARRLLLPWGLWAAVYAAQNLQRHTPVLDTSLGLVAGVMAGPSIHLWYLPFVFLVLVGLDVLHAHLAPRAAAALFGATALLLVAGAPVWRPVSLALPYPLLQWADALAPLAFGAFLQVREAGPAAARRALVAAVLVAAAVTMPFNGIGVSYFVGLAACAAIAWGGLAPLRVPGLPALAGLTLGIYLAHPLVFSLLATHTALPATAMPWATFALSAAGVALGRRLAPRWENTWS